LIVTNVMPVESTSLARSNEISVEQKQWDNVARAAKTNGKTSSQNDPYANIGQRAGRIGGEMGAYAAITVLGYGAGALGGAVSAASVGLSVPLYVATGGTVGGIISGAASFLTLEAWDKKEGQQGAREGSTVGPDVGHAVWDVTHKRFISKLAAGIASYAVGFFSTRL
jgi:hypothetical protein